MSAYDIIQAIKGVREFYRLKQADIDLSDYNFKTILVDPPRSGLDNKTIKFAQTFDNIIYISCNPETLKSNIETMKNSHRIIHFALFDQFPFTKHIEAGIFLQKI
jgi:tRNA (uracil-5-)-methyltransferase